MTSTNITSLTGLTGTFNLLVLGDSIQWGQGLREAEKFHSLVEAELRARNPGLDVRKTVLAHSGAVIGKDNSTVADPLTVGPVGEVPTSYPTILQQCDPRVAYRGPRPEDVHLILVDGGINDVAIGTILNPATTAQVLAAQVRRFCYDDFKRLLVDLRRFTNARVVVTGYYPIVGPWSNPLLIHALIIGLGGATGLGAIGAIVGGILAEWARAQVIANCQAFADQSGTWLYRAVAEERAAPGGNPRISVVLPTDWGLDFQHCALTEHPWIFGTEQTVVPQDGVAGDRQIACAAAIGVPYHGVDGFVCERASMGHPNPEGARAYARGILTQLFPPRRLAVRVEPTPTLLGAPVTLTVRAEDAQSHAPVAGTVRLQNFTSDGGPVDLQFPAGTAVQATFREGRVRVFDQEERVWTIEPASPSGTVSAPDYPSVDVPFTWQPAEQTPTGAPPGAIALYRLLNRTTGDHFYTASAAERDAAVANAGYSGEGLACYVYGDAASAPGTIPLYRLLNRTTGDHFYTASAAERDAAVAQHGYTDEGTACAVFAAQAAGTVPLYRLANARTGDHFYTALAAEREAAVTQLGYGSEGIACYVVPPPAAAFVAQSVPATMDGGRRYELAVTLRNTGVVPWTAEAGFALGAQNPAGTSRWGLMRVPLPGPVAPGADATFRFWVTAPAVTSTTTLNCQWQLVTGPESAPTWFGALTPNVAVTVRSEVDAWRDAVRTRAFSLWLGRGRQPGNDWSDWFRARTELGVPPDLSL
jgi:hypothetical protein